jgi:hypothetical protein
MSITVKIKDKKLTLTSKLLKTTYYKELKLSAQSSVIDNNDLTFEDGKQIPQNKKVIIIKKKDVVKDCIIIIDGNIWNMDIESIIKIYKEKGFYELGPLLEGEFIIIVSENYSDGRFFCGCMTDFMSRRGLYTNSILDTITTIETDNCVKLKPSMYHVRDISEHRELCTKGKYNLLTPVTITENLKKKYLDILSNCIIMRIKQSGDRYRICILEEEFKKNKFSDLLSTLLSEFKQVTIIKKEDKMDGDIIFSYKGYNWFLDKKNDKLSIAVFNSTIDGLDNDSSITYPFLDRELVNFLISIPLSSRKSDNII